MTQTGTKKPDVYFIALHIALVALCIVTLLLAFENRQLKLSAPGGFDAGGPVAGLDVQPIPWLPLEGAETRLDFSNGGRDSVLLVFTTDCPACRENQAQWRGLFQEIEDSADVVGISLSDLEATRSYLEQHGLPFPVGVAKEPASFTSSLDITGVPMTIRVGGDGRVQGSWGGVLSEKQLSEIARADRG